MRTIVKIRPTERTVIGTRTSKASVITVVSTDTKRMSAIRKTKVLQEKKQGRNQPG